MNPEDFKKITEDIVRGYPLCKISSCKYFDSCDKKQVKGDGVKCIKYKHIRDK